MTTIPIINIGLAFLPVGLVLVVMFYWSLNITDGFVALSRMLIQLLLIGYALTWVFFSRFVPTSFGYPEFHVASSKLYRGEATL
jgi:ABC-type iron transport system FetAB permease component